MSSIIALVYISLSELQTVEPRYTEEWSSNNPQELLGVLQGLGLDVNQPWEKQEITHRNKFGNIITCSRWVGTSRLDKEWIESGYASREAIDKASGSKLITDLYRQRGMTE
jgi:hypothetical protein